MLRICARRGAATLSRGGRTGDDSDDGDDSDGDDDDNGGDGDDDLAKASGRVEEFFTQKDTLFFLEKN